ncbi:MAG: hypothetical protein CR984_02510 [Proteobacteria bacterium]|nr:MAG: hypothetical protein CR984_02510 [Pseudomonadota bacterium]
MKPIKSIKQNPAAGKKTRAHLPTFPPAHFLTRSPSRLPIGTQKAFTLIELMVTLFIIGIMGTVAGTIYLSSEEEAGYEATTQIMADIEQAMLGHYTPVLRGQRIYGYVADIGNLPPLDKNGQPVSLWDRDNLPVRRYDGDARIMVGWNGPYIDPPQSGFLTDGWGNGILFQKQGKGMVITSYGSDGKPGGSGYGQDIVLTIKKEQFMAPVGFELPPGVDNYTLNYPKMGVLKEGTLGSIYGPGKQFLSGNNDDSLVPIGLRSVNTRIDGEDRCFVFSVVPGVNWLGRLR